MTDPKGALLRIASQAREAEVVRHAVEELRDRVGEACVARANAAGDRTPWSYSDCVDDALDCLVALVAGEQWPPKEEK